MGLGSGFKGLELRVIGLEVRVKALRPMPLGSKGVGRDCIYRAECLGDRGELRT